MNFIFCKWQARGGPMEWAGRDWASLVLSFLEMSMTDSGLGERVMWWIGVAIAYCNWRCYDEKRSVQYIFCSWYISEIHNGRVKNWGPVWLPILFWNEHFFKNPGMLRIFVKETSMLNMYLYLQFFISKGYKSKNEENCDEEKFGISGTHILLGKYVLIKLT